MRTFGIRTVFAVRALALMGLLVGLGACSTIVPQRYQLTAAPLASIAEVKKQFAMDAATAPAGTPLSGPTTLVTSTATPTNLDLANYLVQDSQTKCADFVNSMFSRTAGTNVVLDVFGTLFSALGTVFTPVGTMHALSAAATVTGAGKTAISADFLNNVTISHITQAIQSTYTARMQGIIADLDSYKASPDDVNVLQVRSLIQANHVTCSLASADGTIVSALTTGSGQAGSTSTTYTVSSTAEDATTIRSHILTLINTSPTFQTAGVQATPAGGGTARSATLSLIKPSNVTVTASVTAVATAKSAGETITAGTDGASLIIAVPGAAQVGDKFTITATTAGGTSPSGNASSPPAAIAGAPPPPTAK